MTRLDTSEHAVRVVVPAAAINGEGPQWDERRRCLWWVDMRRPALHAYEPATGATSCWQMPAWIGCFGISRDGPLVVALRTGLARFDPADGSLVPLAAAPYDLSRFCFNDGGCDRAGHLLVGPMYHPLTPGEVPPQSTATASIWRYEPARNALVALRLPPVHTANGLAFSPDGRTLYHADTPRKTIWACDYDPSDGDVANHRVFARVEEGGAEGGPDGAVVDRDGFYICAVFGGGCLLRFDPDGRLERRLPIPVRYPTMPALGGDDLATLYVTSASFPADSRGDGGDDGGVFALAAPVPGLPTSYMTLTQELP